MTSPAQLGPAPASEPAETQAEADAWASVLAAWEDDAAHAGYLSRFHDLEGLAVALLALAAFLLLAGTLGARS